MSFPAPGAGPPRVRGDVLRRSWPLAALLASLTMIGPFAIDMYLPAFPAIGVGLNASPIAVQQTLSTYLFAYAVMMLWHGALTDALGRRAVILGGLAVFAVATLGCAIAGNIETLWLFRTLQGLSAGTGLVAGRAIIRDSFHGPEAQRLMSQITMVFAVAPAIAPVLGGILLNTFGWRSIFWALLVFVVAVIGWAGKRLPETHPRELRRPLRPRALWHGYRAVLLRGDFLLLALIPALNFSAFFVYIASAPAFLIDLLGVTTWGFAWLFLPMIAGVMIGAFLSGRLAGHRSPERTIRLGYALLFGGAVANSLICLLAPPMVALNVAPIMVFTIGSSLVMPSVTLLMLDLFPGMRGMASSLQGFLQFGISGVTAATVAPLLSRSLSALALGMTAFTVASFLLWLVYQRRARPQLKAWKP
jgi:DHA1 family bicyclomycin/chloramphenicol resistance-like MFS transporter